MPLLAEGLPDLGMTQLLTHGLTVSPLCSQEMDDIDGQNAFHSLVSILQIALKLVDA